MSIHQDMLKAKHQVDILTGYHELKTVPSGLDAQPINSTYAQMVANKGKGPVSSKKPPTSSTKATEDEGMGFVEALFDRSVVMHKCLSSQQGSLDSAGLTIRQSRQLPTGPVPLGAPQTEAYLKKIGRPC